MDNQRKDHIDPKRLPQRNPTKQLQTDNILTYYMKNTTGTNKGRDLWLSNKPGIVVPRRTDRMLQRIQRHRRATLHWSVHRQRKQEGTEKFSYSLDWQQKDIRYHPAKLDNKLLSNVQNNRWNHKFYRKNHGNLESGIDSRREKMSWSEDPKRCIPGRCTITITIYYNDDVTQPHTQKMYWRIPT